MITPKSAFVFAPALREFARECPALRLHLASVGRFPSNEGVVFLAPVVTRKLLELHTRLHGMPPVAAGTRREYYLPGRWVPHCTIAEGLEPDDICATVELARSSGACRDVSIQEVGLVQFGPYRMIAVYPVSPESPTPPPRVRRRTSRCMAMKNPPHPGLSVRHDCLEPLGLSVTEGALVLGVSRKQLSDIVNCRSGISPEMAIRLDKAFGGGAETWYRLQATYDLAQAMRKAGAIKVQRRAPAA